MEEWAIERLHLSRAYITMDVYSASVTGQQDKQNNNRGINLRNSVISFDNVNNINNLVRIS